MSTDYQRSKEYRAEWGLQKDYPKVKETVTLDEVTALYAAWGAHFKTRPPVLQVNTRFRTVGGTATTGWGIPVVTFASETPPISTVLHEFAHCLGGHRHGWRFAASLLKLYEFHFDTATSLALSRHFDRAGVIYTKAQGEKRQARLKKAAAASFNRDEQTGVGWVLVYTGNPGHPAAALSVDGGFRASYPKHIKVYRREHNAYRRLENLNSSWEVWRVEVRYSHDLSRWIPNGVLEEVRLSDE